MSALASGRFGAGLRASMPSGTFLDSEPRDGTTAPSGIVIDGAVYALGGQPPPARAGSWGNLSWLRSSFYTGGGGYGGTGHDAASG